MPLFEPRDPLPREMKARTLAGDVQAYKAFFTHGAAVSDPLDEVPATIGVPCLVFVGEDDFALEGASRAAAEIPKATLVTLPNLDHPQAFMQSNLVLPHVRQFLESLDH